mgnify:CR=1 FL=1
MYRYRNISAMDRVRHRVVGIGVARQVAWGLEMALAAEKCAPLMAKSATEKEK